MVNQGKRHRPPLIPANLCLEKPFMLTTTLTTSSQHPTHIREHQSPPLNIATFLPLPLHLKNFSPLEFSFLSEEISLFPPNPQGDGNTPPTLFP